MRLPRVRPSYSENPSSGFVNCALRAWRYSRRLRFCEGVSTCAQIGMSAHAHLLRCLESWYSSLHLVGQSASSLSCVLGLQLFNQCIDLVNGLCNTPPLRMLTSTTGLAIYTESGILLAFDQIVLSLVAVKAPVLDRQWLVEIIVAA
jgi:hypothetical protein